MVMRSFLVITFSMLMQAAHAQNVHWKAIPLRFDNAVYKIYNDEAIGALIIAGMFQQVNGLACNLVQWDGHNPYYFPRSSMFITGGIIRHKGLLYTAGNGGLMYFKGNTWSIIDNGNYGAFNFFRIINGNLVVAGGFDRIANQSIGYAASWDGNSWSNFYRLDTLLESNGNSGSILNMEVYKGQIYLGGNFFLGDKGMPKIKEIVRFDGTHWTDVGGGVRGNNLSSVNKMLVWKNELYVAGEFFEQDGAPGNCIAKWDGQRWHRLGDGLTQGGYEAAVYDMTVFNDNLYVVGPFTEAGGIKARNFAKWDGKRWCSINDTFQNQILTINTYKGELYIGGAFKSINGDTTMNRLAVWTGGDHTRECSAEYLEDPAMPDAIVFPNPASNTFYVNVADPRKVWVYDVCGKLVIKVAGDMISNGIDISGLAKGIYFVKIETGNNTLTSRLLKI